MRPTSADTSPFRRNHPQKALRKSLQELLRMRPPSAEGLRQNHLKGGPGGGVGGGVQKVSTLTQKNSQHGSLHGS